MSLPIKPPFAPMEALLVDEIPKGEGWEYEPKWDGFRCLIFRDGKKLELQSKAGQPLTRYFPEMAEAASNLPADKFVLDGELVIPEGKTLSFDQLLQRIHPAESRVRKLSAEHPALFIAFDLLVDGKGKSWIQSPLKERRKNLELFAANYFPRDKRIRLSPAASDLKTAEQWFKRVGTDLDGIIAKRLDCPYMSGERSGMEKVKLRRTADCVVGGFRYATKKKVIGSLLLGLYDESGVLHHVGFCSGLNAKERLKLVATLKPLIKPPGFTGRAPGGPSRWSTERSTEWQPLDPKLVVEVSYDHFTSGRFRHGTKLLRWRPDKAPTQCRMEQVAATGEGLLRLVMD
ncbi:MAG TPA: ATP-dependent DNA ligase [Candidatus Saccharimonadales bacterium]|nr:ATP-dependent DNA ligase [Candidatus Saccharimonadales bacterium]